MELALLTTSDIPEQAGLCSTWNIVNSKATDRLRPKRKQTRQSTRYTTPSAASEHSAVATNQGENATLCITLGTSLCAKMDNFRPGTDHVSHIVQPLRERSNSTMTVIQNTNASTQDQWRPKTKGTPKGALAQSHPSLREGESLRLGDPWARP